MRLDQVDAKAFAASLMGTFINSPCRGITDIILCGNLLRRLSLFGCLEVAGNP